MAVNDSIHYQVPDSLRDALLPYAGKEVDLGVRPEYIDLSFSMERTKGYLCDTVIDFVEPQGSHAILITRIGGNEVKIHTTAYMEMAPKTNVALNVKDDKVMFLTAARLSVLSKKQISEETVKRWKEDSIWIRF